MVQRGGRQKVDLFDQPRWLARFGGSDEVVGEMNGVVLGPLRLLSTKAFSTPIKAIRPTKHYRYRCTVGTLVRRGKKKRRARKQRVCHLET